MYDGDMAATTQANETRDARSRDDWQGMNWIRQDKRLAIYLRDDLACVWCGDGIEQGVQLSLDHLTPHSKGGGNHESNLVTCCTRCNSKRQARTMTQFAADVAAYTLQAASEIKARIRRNRARKMTGYRAQAKQMIASSGSAAAAIQQ